MSLDARGGMRLAGVGKDLNRLSYEVIGAALEVHKELGPGLLERRYHLCLVDALAAHGLRVRSEVPLPIVFRGRQLESAYRVDIDVEERILVEVKAVEAITPLHRSQLWTYLKLTGRRLGLVLNFNVHHLRDGVARVVGPDPP